MVFGKKIIKSIFYNFGSFFLKFPRLAKLFGINLVSWKQRHLYTKYRGRFRKIIDNFEITDKTEQRDEKINVWLYWHQGFDNAPEIVKACIKSIERNFNNDKYLIHYLSKDNVFNTIQFPKHILKKYDNGKINIAHFSDILRTRLLEKYGGYWFDSTTLITHRTNFFDIVEKQNLFLFKRVDLGHQFFNKHYICNWFIYSKKGNNMLALMNRLLEEYWKINNKAEDYYIYHILFALVIDKFTVDFKNIPTYNNCSPHILMFELFDKFDKDRYSEILKMSPVHKLTRYVSKNDSTEYTYYDFVLETFNK